MGANGLGLTGADADGDCVMLWTQAFTVNSVARAVMANMGVFALALLAQFLTTANANRMQRAKQYAKRKRSAFLLRELAPDPENGRSGSDSTNSSYESTTDWRRQGVQVSCCGEPLPQVMTIETVSNWEHLADSVQHGLRIFVAYLLMLAAMTYDIALISSTVAGFMLGYFFFTKDTTRVPESADPCCS